MNSSPDEDLKINLDKPTNITLEKLVYILCTLIGASTILVWLFGYEKVLNLFPNNATIKFNTAILFLLVGINLYILHNSHSLIMYLCTHGVQ